MVLAVGSASGYRKGDEVQSSVNSVFQLWGRLPAAHAHEIFQVYAWVGG